MGAPFQLVWINFFASKRKQDKKNIHFHIPSQIKPIMKSMSPVTTKMAVYCIALILLLIRCSKDNEEVKPVDDDNEPPPITSITKTIGSDGGTIALDSIIITIPAGAFGEDHSLKLSWESNPVSHPKPAVTSVFMLDGMPRKYSKPIQLSLKYNGELHDESYIARGYEKTFPYMDTTMFIYELINCQDSSGYLTGYIVQPEKEKDESGRKMDLLDGTDNGEVFNFYLGLTSNKYVKNEYFEYIKYPTTLDPQLIEQLISSAEDLYFVYYNLGFHDVRFPSFPLKCPIIVWDYRGANHNKKPISFFPHTKRIPDPPYEDEEIEQYYYEIRSPQSDYVLREAIGKGFFYQFMMNTNIIGRFEYGGAFARSVFSWMEEKWNEPEPPQSFVPSCFSKNDFKVDLVIFSGNSTNSEVIKFLVTRYGYEILAEYFQKVDNGVEEHIALSQSIDDPVNVWMPDFFQRFFERDVYRIPEQTFSEKVIDNSINTVPVIIPSPNETKTHLQNYMDFSAKVYYIDLEDNVLTEHSKLSIALTSNDIDPINLVGLLFKIDRSSKVINFIEKGTNFEINDPLGLDEDNLDVMVVVVNSQTTNMGENRDTNLSNVEFDITLKEVEIVQLNYRRMLINLDGVNITRIYNDDHTETFENVDYQFSFPSAYTGSFSDNENFTGDWDYYYDSNTNYWGEVEATVDPESLMLTEFDFKVGSKNYYNGEFYSEIRRRITGINVQLEQEPGLLIAEIQGTSLIQYISIFDYIVDYVDPEKNETDGYYTEIDFTENSVMTIGFYDAN